MCGPLRLSHTLKLSDIQIVKPPLPTTDQSGGEIIKTPFITDYHL